MESVILSMLSVSLHEKWELNNLYLCVTAALVLPGISKIWEMSPVGPADDSGDVTLWGRQDRYRYQILVAYSGGFVKGKDTTASRYQQSTTSRLGRHDLLLQKIVVLAPPYSQSYGAPD